VAVESLTRRSAPRYSSAAESPSDPLKAERRLAAAVLMKAVRDGDRDFLLSTDCGWWLRFVDHPLQARSK
jgi:hypothetical protein